MCVAVGPVEEVSSPQSIVVGRLGTPASVQPPFAVTVSGALPIAGVTVHVRTQVRFGVVQVKGDDLVQADGLLEFVECSIPARGCSNVVSGGEEMSGI